MRRTDRESGIEAAKKILASAEYGVLSMSSRDGAPHGVPLNFAFSEDGIIFHCAREGVKIDLLTENPKVSFCAVGGTEVQPAQFATKYESVIVTGHAEELFDEDKHRGLALLIEKYSPGRMKEGLEYIARDIDRTKVFRIRIESITGKARL